MHGKPNGSCAGFLPTHPMKPPFPYRNNIALVRGRGTCTNRAPRLSSHRLESVIGVMLLRPKNVTIFVGVEEAKRIKIAPLTGTRRNVRKGLLNLLLKLTALREATICKNKSICLSEYFRSEQIMSLIKIYRWNMSVYS